jgi:elongation of very long chain fatty acids protein 4
MASTTIATVLGIICLALIVAPTKQFSDEVKGRILTWSTFPNPPGKATQGWAVTDLDQALKISAVYLLLVAVGLLMKKPGEEEGTVSPAIEKPVKALQLLYNFAQCFLCTYMIYRAVAHFVKKGYSPICNEFNTNETGMAEALQIFYLSKIFDFCDTLFIVLRQKWKQFSFLHIYHHVSIFLIYWLLMNVGYDGDVYLTIVLNSFVHLVMYSYYFLATLGYSAWWKNYITLLQMGQFLLMNAQAIYILYFGCPYPRNITMAYLFYIISLFLLFRDFYQRTYTKRPSRPTVTKKSN